MLRKRNIGSTMILKRSLLFLFFMIATMANAQISFEAEVSKKTLGINENLRVEFKLNREGDNFIQPSFEGFRIVGIPRQSVSNSYYNGKRSILRTFSFDLAPLKKGTLTIGQAQIEVEGNVYKTSPVQVVVTEAVEKPTDADNQTALIEDGVHIVAEVSKTNPYLNEAVSLTYKLYVSHDVNITQNFRYLDRPNFKGFWNQEVEERNNQVYEGKYKGRDYRYIILEKVLLFPQNTGELIIDPLTLDIPIDVPTNRRDFFGRRLSTTINRTVASNTITLQVKDLPAQGKPASFTGAVGEFRMELDSSKDSLLTQESLNLNLKISGKGNMRLFKMPALDLESSFETYDPERKESIRSNASGMQGAIEEIHTIVPEKAGKYSLGPVEFSYFDPSEEKYKTLLSKTFELYVAPSIQISRSSVSSINGPDSGRNILSDMEQFKFIHLKTNLQNIKTRSVYLQKPIYWVSLLLPILFVPILILIGRWKKLSLADTDRNRLREADKMAKRYLGEAKKKENNKEAFYEALELALHNFLKAKLNIQTNDISKDKIAKFLEDKEVKKENITEFIQLLTSCEMARYAAASVDNTEVNYSKAIQTITELNKQIK